VKTGLFLDVDGVLTIEPVNLQLARFLGVEEELNQLEIQFGSGEIDTSTFGRNLVDTFRKAGLTRQYVAERFPQAQNELPKIRMTIGYEKLLKDPSRVFLVSSGPNYFLELLVDHHKIHRSHLVCSQYLFDKGPDGRIRDCELPVGDTEKVKHVQDFQSEFQFDITVGVGDQPAVDSQFVSQCDIGILMGEWKVGYLSTKAKDLSPLVGLVKALDGCQPSAAEDVTRGEPVRIFIGSSSEDMRAASAVQAELTTQLGNRAETTIWAQLPQTMSTNIIDMLVTQAKAHDFAVLLFGADDLLIRRGEEGHVTRDNVIFETGLFAGQLGIDHVYIVAKHVTGALMPSDLSGVILAPYNPDRKDGNIQAAVGTACFKIAETIKRSDEWKNSEPA
jgi:predicted nucleotide-binding protein/phosphoserine phosphatase